MHEIAKFPVSWAVSKKKWNTKEDKGKSVVCTVVCQRAPVKLK